VSVTLGTVHKKTSAQSPKIDPSPCSQNVLTVSTPPVAYPLIMRTHHNFFREILRFSQ